MGPLMHIALYCSKNGKRVFAYRFSDLGSIPGWFRLEYFRSTTGAFTVNNPFYDRPGDEFKTGGDECHRGLGTCI